ncbi:MAG: hypothetical protein ABI846_12065 [Rudaea sp.]
MNVATLFAWLLPLLVGAAVYLAASPERLPGWRSAAGGYGIVIGLLLVSACTAIVARSDTAHAWLRAAPLLAIVGIGAALVFRRRSRSLAAARDSDGNARAEMPRWKRTLLGVLFASLGLRAVVALREIWLRPLYPWDAWSAWAVKAKAWFLLGHHVRFVSLHDWLVQSGKEYYTSIAWMYPVTLAWVDIWFASAAGGWVEPLVNLPWLALWIAVLLAHYGQWRALGVSRDRALFFVYVLGSLPLLLVHAALAGYADLWIAAVFGLALLAWVRWLQSRDRGQLVLAIALACVLPCLKVEGWIWASCLLATIVFGALSARWRWLVLAAAAIFVGVLLGGGLRWLLEHVGWLDAAGGIVDARAGSFVLLLQPQWHGAAARDIASALFALPNWHFLWWLVPVALACRWREIGARTWLWLPAFLLLQCFAALAFLFLATDAAQWAKSFTAINRLILQLTPAVVTLVALALRDAQLPATASGTAPVSVARIDRA